MVTNIDKHLIGFDYFGLEHTRRKQLPFSDVELEVIAKYMRVDNKRKLSNDVLQQMAAIDRKHTYSNYN